MPPDDFGAEIHSASEIAPALRETFERWFEEEFGYTRIQWAAPAWYVVIASAGAPIGRLGVLTRTILSGGSRVRVGGIGGVATRPEWRHRGVASAAMRTAQDLIARELGCAFGLLLCRREVSPVYAKLGWQVVAGPTMFEQSGKTLVYPNLTMVMRFGADEWPEGPIDLCGLPW